MVDATILPEGRVCTKCAEWKPASEFYVCSRDGMIARCRKCMYAQQKAWRDKNPGAMVATMARRRARRLALMPIIQGIPRITAEGKRCSKCELRKPIKDFTTDRSNPDGKSHRCRDCTRKDHRTWRSINAVELRKKHTRLHRLKRFGITAEAFESILIAQDYKCPICLNDLVMGTIGNGKNACIDHDHESGAVRGVLCATCNRALGLLKDEKSFVERAVQYLRRPVLCYRLT